MLAVALATQERMRKGGKTNDELDELVILSRKALLASNELPKVGQPTGVKTQVLELQKVSALWMKHDGWLQDDQAKVRRLEQAGFQWLVNGHLW